MKGRLIRALGVGAALLLPVGGVALLGTTTAGAALTTSHVKAKFSFKTSSGTTLGSATCTTQSLTTTTNCTTAGATGPGTGTINNLKSGGTITGTTLTLSTSVTFTVTTAGTACTIHLGRALVLKKTTNHHSTTFGEYVGTARITVPPATVTPTSTTCTALLSTLKTGTFHASVSPS